MKKDIIVFPIFLECLQFISDSFWENVFEELAYGRSPYGTYFSKDSLCCNYKDKEFNYKIEKKDPEILYNEVYDLLLKKLGLLSQKDKIKKKIDFQNIEKDLKEYRKTWNNIRKKNIKDCLIEKYVIDMRKKYSLDIKQSRNLLSNIYIGMIFKVIKSKDIIYEDGEITNIEGISFKKKQVIFEKDIYNAENNFRKCILIDNKLMSDNWEKYLEKLKKLL